jgi:hypothetical protein
MDHQHTQVVGQVSWFIHKNLRGQRGRAVNSAVNLGFGVLGMVSRSGRCGCCVCSNTHQGLVRSRGHYAPAKWPVWVPEYIFWYIKAAKAIFLRTKPLYASCSYQIMRHTNLRWSTPLGGTEDREKIVGIWYNVTVKKYMIWIEKNPPDPVTEAGFCEIQTSKCK